MGPFRWLWRESSLAHHRWDILRRIRKRGWTALYVDGEGTPFCYTIGLSRALDAPEIFMSGVGHFYSNVLLGRAYAQMLSGELVVADGVEWSADAETWPRLTWKAVHRSQIRADFLAALLYIRENRGETCDGLRVFQLVFPDDAGVMPWEDGYDWDHRPRQEMLWLPHSDWADWTGRPHVMPLEATAPILRRIGGGRLSRRKLGPKRPRRT